ncbi:peptidoglycan DD-metalloendopeptidase family protein [Clostridium aminobutyricum]|uniref:Peptidoglycan DD-metalloendopeptidase family protein n=1 Tax=Clostridium aminobutyricum TaxID=33953 RepID=A0A939D936_CLOAM|nr:peptidoglycan DD-metalloendopeptidase family protein [Clostridium aminobutyricum]MBN7773385.1 peptidoglycan DD-metalloendopeptidase family protein [Clostridium aminobutyricum]
MAKFFEKSLDKLKNRKRPSEEIALQEQEEVTSTEVQQANQRQSMISDLENLGRSPENDFLKSFPKTPTQIAEEEALARVAQEEAAMREKLEQLAAEESTKKIAEELDKQKKEVREPEQSGKENKRAHRVIGNSKAEKRAVREINSLEKQFADFIISFQDMTYILGKSILSEFVHVGDFVKTGFRNLRSHIFWKIENYYSQYPEKRWERHQKNRKLMRQLIQTKNTLIAKEKATAARMVHFINHLDRTNEELADKTTVIVTVGNEKFNLAREWAELNKAKLLMHFAVVVAVVLCIAAVFNYTTAYEYAYNGRTLGIVEKQEDVLKIVDIVSRQLSKEHSVEIYIDRDRDITFQRVLSLNKEIDNTEDVLNKLTYMKDMSAKAYGIYVNGIRVAIVDSKKTAGDLFDEIESEYLSSAGTVQYESVDFKEKVEIKQIDTKLGRIQNPEIVRQKLLTGAVSQQTHEVKSGDTLSGIAQAYGMKISDLKEANPTLNPEKLSIGQKIVLTKPAPLVTIKTVEVATYRQEIPYSTEEQQVSTLYKGESSVKVQGVNGEEQVTARITRENGVQVNTEILASQILSEPVAKVVLKGTKELPPLQGTGSLKYPVSGARLTSKFGTRWGRMHYGIDLACPVGTAVRAADGGTVTFAGYSGSYGYVVKISHGGGVVTLYAHNSKLLVSKGDRVYQGQQIAKSGNTGRSTGPHCHFQVEINGVPKNPLNYL